MQQDYLPALVNSAFFLVGLLLIYFLRRPLLNFLDSALRGDTSITVHEFLARHYEDDRRVRLMSSLLTLVALTGIAIGEIFGVSAVLKPLLLQNIQAVYVFVFGMLILMFLYTVNSGNSGVMRSDQAQLGVAYVGLFTATLLMLQLVFQPGRETPTGILAVTALFGVGALAMLLYRRFRFLDTSLLQLTDTSDGPESSHPISVRLFNYFEKTLNLGCILLAILLVVFSLTALRSFPPSLIASDFAAAFGHTTKFSNMGLFALALLPVFYQFVDITNWQRIAAFEKTNAELPDRDRSFRRSLLVYVIESPLVWFLMCIFGTLTSVAFMLPANGDISSLSEVLKTGNAYDMVVLCALLAAVFGIALSTMSSVFSASLSAIRYDILPSVSPNQSAGSVTEEQEVRITRRTIALGIGVYLIIAVGLYGVDSAGITFGSSQYLSLLFAFYCSQLSFVPLIIGPLIGRSTGYVSAGWALGVLSAGALSGIGTVGWYLYSGDDWWLWLAVPACLGCGTFVYGLARLLSRRRNPLLKGGRHVRG